MGSENGILTGTQESQEPTTFTSRRCGDWQHEITLETEVMVGLKTGRLFGSCLTSRFSPCLTQPGDRPSVTQADDCSLFSAEGEAEVLWNTRRQA